MKQNLPITNLGNVLRMDSCQKQKDMCWDYDGFVLAHKDVNPGFDREKPFMVVIDQDGAWQMHFENFGSAPKNEKVLDDMYKALAASCEKGMELQAVGGATPGGISGISKLQDYGFKKVPMPDDSPVYWGGELDREKLEKWLNSGRHDDDFLVKDGGKFVRPDEYGGEITPDNTKPRPFKMVKENRTDKIAKDNKMNRQKLNEFRDLGDRSYWVMWLKEYPQYIPNSQAIKKYLAGLFDRRMQMIDGLRDKLEKYARAYDMAARLIPYERMKTALLESFGPEITDRNFFWEPIPA